jgi:hypothetical protein
MEIIQAGALGEETPCSVGKAFDHEWSRYSRRIVLQSIENVTEGRTVQREKWDTLVSVKNVTSRF